MADPVGAAKDVADKATGAAKNVLSWGFNQLNPLPGGKLGRTLMITAGLALVGITAGAVAPAAAAGAAGASAGTITTTATAAAAAAKPTILGSAWSTTSGFVGHAWDGVGVIGKGVSSVDYSSIGKGFMSAFGAGPG